MRRKHLKIVSAAMFAGLLAGTATPAATQAQSTHAAPMPSLREPAPDRLAASVALYPDALLAQMLMAATYPLDVAEAARWAARHPAPSRADIAALRWENSVKALLPFAPILALLDKEKSWTRQLADAVRKQPDTLLQTIQALRQDGIVTIAPVDRRTLYIPYYNPAKVYGAAGNSMLPPEYWAAQPYAAPRNADTAGGVVFSVGVPVRDLAFYDARIDWRANRLLARQTVIDAAGASAGLSAWRHDPQYRKRKPAASAASGNAGGAGNGYAVGTDIPPDPAASVSTRDAGSAPPAAGGYRISTQPRR